MATLLSDTDNRYYDMHRRARKLVNDVAEQMSQEDIDRMDLQQRLKKASPRLLQAVKLLQDECSYLDLTTLAFAMRVKAPHKRFPRDELEMAEMIMQGLLYIESVNAVMVRDKMLDKDEAKSNDKPF